MSDRLRRRQAARNPLLTQPEPIQSKPICTQRTQINPNQPNPTNQRADKPSPPGQTNHGFIKAATPHLVPVLLEQLTKQEEGQEADESTWNLAMSAGTCLGLMARVAGNEVVPVVGAGGGRGVAGGAGGRRRWAPVLCWDAVGRAPAPPTGRRAPASTQAGPPLGASRAREHQDAYAVKAHRKRPPFEPV